jgi:aminoglycoside phosphotransferase (APT) family kinase protein
MSKEQSVAAVQRQFEIPGEFLGAAPYGSGHINDTWCAVFQCSGGPARVILQRINRNVFTNPPALMENIGRVSSHLAYKVSHEPDRERRALTLIPARNGRVWHEDEDGNVWRAWTFIERAHTYDSVVSENQAFQVGKAFGQFQKMLADLPAPRLHEIIPDFHHTPKRFAALERAVLMDAAGRAILAKPEIEFALARKPIIRALLDADLPERVTHNDTKFNNVLLDDETGEAICVVDLDTVMPGLALYDFGDMVRTATSLASEDERDLSRANLEFPLFEALVRGYLGSAGTFLTKLEREYLAFSGKLITFEQGVRFLTDYLAGDTYYKVHRDGQNLDRCRAQFKLVESIERQEEKMDRLVRSIEA